MANNIPNLEIFVNQGTSALGTSDLNNRQGAGQIVFDQVAGLIYVNNVGYGLSASQAGNLNDLLTRMSAAEGTITGVQGNIATINGDASATGSIAYQIANALGNSFGTGDGKYGDVSAAITTILNRISIQDSLISGIQSTAIQNVNGVTGTSVVISGSDINVGGTDSHKDNKINVAIEDIYGKINTNENNAQLSIYKDGATSAISNPTIGADGSEYVLKQGDSAIAKFKIGKELVVNSGYAVQATNKNTPDYYTGTWTNGQWYIVLTITNQDAPIVIPAEGLVDAYTANNTGHNVEITINTNNNQISAALTSDASTKLEHGQSAYTTQQSYGNIVTHDASEFDVAGAAATAAAGVQSTLIGTGSDGTGVNTIYGAKAYANAKAQSSAQQAEKNAKSYADTKAGQVISWTVLGATSA